MSGAGRKHSLYASAENAVRAEFNIAEGPRSSEDGATVAESGARGPEAVFEGASVNRLGSKIVPKGWSVRADA